MSLASLYEQPLTTEELDALDEFLQEEHPAMAFQLKMMRDCGLATQSTVHCRLLYEDMARVKQGDRSRYVALFGRKMSSSVPAVAF